MSELLTTSNIMFVIGIIGMLFSIFLYFTKPQEQLDKRQALDKEEIEGKASILERQAQWEKEANEKKFSEMGVRLDTAMTTAQNHIHTVDVKVDTLIGTVNAMSNEITRLSTIIEERIPKRLIK